MWSLDKHGNANAQPSSTCSAHKRLTMSNTQRCIHATLFAASLATAVVLETNCIHLVNSVLCEMPFMQAHANAVLQRLLAAAVTLHGATNTRQDPHLDISFVFCFVSFGFRIFVCLHYTRHHAIHSTPSAAEACPAVCLRQKMHVPCHRLA